MTSRELENKNLLACLTPAGAGAIATLALTGPDVWTIACSLFRRRGEQPLPEHPQAGKFWLGQLGEDAAASDDVILAVKQAVPLPLLEIHLHGGIEAVRLLQEIFAKRGVKVHASRDVVLATGVDAWSVAALEALTLAPTVRTAGIILDQVHGAFHRARTRIEEMLQRDQEDAAGAAVQDLAQYVPLCQHLVEPWRVVLAGAPNVGKSSLVNAIAGYARSVVAPTPGTTRDVVTATVALDGWPVQVTDTAGLRDQGDALEQQGMLRAQRAIAEADLRLWILDGSQPPQVAPGAPDSWRYVINKIDLPRAWDWDQFPGAWQVSAATGQGVNDLCQAIADTLVPHRPPPGAAAPCTARMCDWVEKFVERC